MPLSISDDDYCATCAFCLYRPGDQSDCLRAFSNGDWPAEFDEDGYAITCERFTEQVATGENVLHAALLASNSAVTVMRNEKQDAQYRRVAVLLARNNDRPEIGLFVLEDGRVIVFAEQFLRPNVRGICSDTFRLAELIELDRIEDIHRDPTFIGFS